MIEIDVDMGYLLEDGEPDCVTLNDENGEFEPMTFHRDNADAVDFCKRVESAVRERKPLELFGVSYEAVGDEPFCETVDRWLNGDAPQECRECPDGKYAELTATLGGGECEWATDSEGVRIDVADTVHMLRSEYDGDHEWEDVVCELAYCKHGGDKWIVRGARGDAWACDCTVMGHDDELYEKSDDWENLPTPWDAEQPCYATQANYEHCKYSTNRGWCDDSNYDKLFGTPERAARTLVDISERANLDGIGGDYDALLEWLRGDA